MLIVRTLPIDNQLNNETDKIRHQTFDRIPDPRRKDVTIKFIGDISLITIEYLPSKFIKIDPAHRHPNVYKTQSRTTFREKIIVILLNFTFKV